MFDPEDFLERTGLQLTDEDVLDASAITPAVYERGRAPRFGSANPERMNNPLWEWLIRTGINAYRATKRFEGPSPFDAGPAWCFDRLGQSVTLLPDGRRVFIAGEHEDHYDPDFYIYNDVILWDSVGKIEILGYPREVFPPTDFHTATLVPGAIVIVGCLGYPDERSRDMTRVARLSLEDWSISAVETNGEQPAWLRDHCTEYDEARNVLRISRGYVGTGSKDCDFQENLDDWELDLSSWQWTRTLTRNWERRRVARMDKKWLDLSTMEHALTPDPLGAVSIQSLEALGLADEVRDMLVASNKRNAELAKELRNREVELGVLKRLFRPDVHHEVISPEEAESFGDKFPNQVKRIRIEGVIVRYVDDGRHIDLVVEGDLQRTLVDQLAEDLRHKLEIIQGVTCCVSAI